MRAVRRKGWRTSLVVLLVGIFGGEAAPRALAADPAELPARAWHAPSGSAEASLKRLAHPRGRLFRVGDFAALEQAVHDLARDGDTVLLEAGRVYTATESLIVTEGITVAVAAGEEPAIIDLDHAFRVSLTGREGGTSQRWLGPMVIRNGGTHCLFISDEGGPFEGVFSDVALVEANGEGSGCRIQTYFDRPITCTFNDCTFSDNAWDGLSLSGSPIEVTCNRCAAERNGTDPAGGDSSGDGYTAHNFSWVLPCVLNLADCSAEGNLKSACTLSAAAPSTLNISGGQFAGAGTLGVVYYGERGRGTMEDCVVTRGPGSIAVVVNFNDGILRRCILDGREAALALNVTTLKINSGASFSVEGNTLHTPGLGNTITYAVQTSSSGTGRFTHNTLKNHPKSSNGRGINLIVPGVVVRGNIFSGFRYCIKEQPFDVPDDEEPASSDPFYNTVEGSGFNVFHDYERIIHTNELGARDDMNLGDVTGDPGFVGEPDDLRLLPGGIADSLDPTGAVAQMPSFSLLEHSFGQGAIVCEPAALPADAGAYMGPAGILACSAEPEEGSVFVEWRRDLLSAENPQFLTMDRNRWIVAVFEPLP